MIGELKDVGDSIVEFMQARAVQVEADDYRRACNMLFASFEHLEAVNQRQHRALKKIESVAADMLEEL